MTAIKDDILKPRLGVTEGEALRMNMGQVLIQLTKIIEEDVCKYQDGKDAQKKAEESRKEKK